MKTSALAIPGGTPSNVIPARPDTPTTIHDNFEIALVNNIARRIASSVPLQDVLNEIVEILSAVVQNDSCVIYVLEKDDLVLRASKNPHPEIVDRLKMKLGQGITGWVAEHKEPVAITKGAYEDPRFKLFNELPEDRFESFLSVPVVSGGKLVGVINVQNRASHQHSKQEISLIATIGFLAGAEIERVRLEAENVELADQLETRKVVERAKGILQRDLHISEEEAYLTLQRESRQRRKTMKEVSEAIILTEDLMRKR